MKSEHITRSILSDGLLIAGATALGYLTSYCFEVGYFNHFELPIEFIAPNTATILFVVVSFLAMFGSTANILGFTAPLLRSALDPRKSPYRLLFVLMFLIAVGIIFVRYAYGWGWRQTLYTSIGALLLLLFLFAPPLLSFRRDRKPMSERFQEHADVQATDPFHVSSIFEIWFSSKTIMIAISPLILLAAAYILGNGEAAKKTKFLTLDTAPDKVVLRAYNDMLIVGNLSRETHTVGNKIEIIWLSEKKEVQFWNEKVGPLTLKEQAESR